MTYLKEKTAGELPAADESANNIKAVPPNPLITISLQRLPQKLKQMNYLKEEQTA